MWIEFFLAFVWVTALLFVPGYLVLSCCRFKGAVAFSAAPVMSILICEIAAIAFGKLGVFTTASSMCAVLAALSLVAAGILVVRRGAARKKPNASRDMTLGERLVPYSGPALFVTLGILLVFVFFVWNLDGPASFLQAYDNGPHLSTVRSFVDRGNYSSLDLNLYEHYENGPFIAAASFYPAAWHLLCAMVVSAFNAPVTLAANVVNTIAAAVIYPAGLWLFVRKVLGSSKRVQVIGALFAVVLGAFPWGMLTFGPLYPNLLSMACMPSVAVAFMVAFEDRCPVSERARYGILFVLGVIALLFMQPNSIFSMAVVLAPFCVYSVSRRFEDRGRRAAIIAGAVAFCVIALIWVGLYKLPVSYMRSTVSFNWPATTTITQAIVDCLTLSFNSGASQLFVATLAAIGALRALSIPSKRWTVAAHGFACLIYISSVATEGRIKHVLSGFWYTDPYRLAAVCAITAIPLAIMGAACLLDLFAALRKRCSEGAERDRMRHPSKAVLIMSGLLVAFLLYYPNFNIAGFGKVSTSLGHAGYKVQQQNDMSADNVLAPEEMAFAKKAMEVIPEGSTVINEPNDGSVFLYPLLNMDVYYKQFALPSGEKEKADSVAIRSGLCDIESNRNVEDAVDKVGAQYVLLLDMGGDPNARMHFWSYYPEQWKGLTSIDDETPGFEKVLGEGDMRLYRIE